MFSSVDIVLIILSVNMFLFFFFKQKTAYEMRISDWSSDVCSSDLQNIPKSRIKGAEISVEAQPIRGLTLMGSVTYLDTKITEFTGFDPNGEIGRAHV